MTWNDLHGIIVAHLETCFEAMDVDIPSPGYAPFDGCPTCIVREALCVVDEYFPLAVTDR